MRLKKSRSSFFWLPKVCLRVLRHSNYPPLAPLSELACRHTTRHLRININYFTYFFMGLQWDLFINFTFTIIHSVQIHFFSSIVLEITQSWCKITEIWINNKCKSRKHLTLKHIMVECRMFVATFKIYNNPTLLNMLADPWSVTKTIAFLQEIAIVAKVQLSNDSEFFVLYYNSFFYLLSLAKYVIIPSRPLISNQNDSIFARDSYRCKSTT